MKAELYAKPFEVYKVTSAPLTGLPCSSLAKTFAFPLSITTGESLSKVVPGVKAITDSSDLKAASGETYKFPHSAGMSFKVISPPITESLLL